MKFLILLIGVLTIFSCGEKAWEGCDGAEYTASVEESEIIFKAESSSYDGFHCPVMEEAWPETDSKAFVDHILGIYKIQESRVFAVYKDAETKKISYAELSFDDLSIEDLGVWQEFTIESLTSCVVAVARSGEDCLDTFELVFLGDKATFRFSPLEKPFSNLTYSGNVVDSESVVRYGSYTIYIDSERIDIDASFVLEFNVEGEEYDGVILSYDKK